VSASRHLLISIKFFVKIYTFPTSSKEKHLL
jgi:hypothetical protein